MITLILAALAAGVIYSLWVLSHPVTICWRCQGKKVRKNTFGRMVKCRRCKATGLAAPPLAGSVHRFWWSVLGDRRQDDRRADVSEQVSGRKKRLGK